MEQLKRHGRRWRSDAALIADFPGAGRVVEFGLAGKEIGIFQLQGGDNQACNIDLGVLAEENAVGIDEQNAAIALQLAENLAEIDAGNAVENLTLGALLNELGEFIPIDVEGRPVDDRPRRVGDGESFSALLDKRLTGGDAGACGVGLSACGKTGS